MIFYDLLLTLFQMTTPPTVPRLVINPTIHKLKFDHHRRMKCYNIESIPTYLLFNNYRFKDKSLQSYCELPLTDRTYSKVISNDIIQRLSTSKDQLETLLKSINEEPLLLPVNSLNEEVKTIEKTSIKHLLLMQIEEIKREINEHNTFCIQE